MAELSPTHPSLARFATAPGVVLPLAEMPQVLRVVSLHATCDLPKDLEDIPDLPDRIRGALGHALERMLQRQKGTGGWLSHVPSLHDILFGKGVPISSRTLSRPFACHVDVIGRSLHIKLVLTGLAASHVKDAEAALVEALHGGIAIKHRSRHRVKVPCRTVDTHWHHGVDVPPVGFDLRLVHRTPMRIRNGNELSPSSRAVLPALLRRTEDIALWNACSVATDIARLSLLANDIVVTEDRRAASPWTRHSRTSGERGQPKLGLTGHLIITGDLLPFGPVFAIASLLHAGSETAHGFGRVEFWSA